MSRLAAGAALFGWSLLAAHGPLLADPVRVETATSEMRAIEHRVQLSGTVVSQRTARLSAEIGGLVQEMHVDIGDRVGEGAPILQMDAALQELALRQTEASTLQARAELAEAQRLVEIARPLAERSTLPKSELDARQAQVRIAGANLQRLEAEEAAQRERVKRYEIRAPFGGVIAAKMTEAGEWITPGTAVAELVETENLRIDVPVPQRYFPDLSQDPEIAFEIDAAPGMTFRARAAAVVPVSDRTARTFTLRLQPETGELPLTPGMSARVMLSLATGEKGIVVPRDALIRYPDGRTTVWVTQRGEESVKVNERIVELGRTFDGFVHVRSGLEAGTEVVVRGNESLNEGEAVRTAGEG